MDNEQCFPCRVVLCLKSAAGIITRTIPDIMTIVTAAAILAWVHFLVVPEPSITVSKIPLKGEVSMETALSWGKNALWLDARKKKDYEKAHVPGALPLSMKQWKKDIAGVMEAQKHKKVIVVYCYHARCDSAEKVARRLRKERGLKNVVVMHGGWKTWKKAHP